jgi:starch-binding outer membrane protein, SusD/RagB family
MNMKSFKIILTVWISSLLMGCGDDFMKVEPQNQYLNINFYTTENQVFQALIAAYDPLQYSYLNGSRVSEVMLGEIWSDNANAGGANDGDIPGWQFIDDFRADPAIIETKVFWKKYYTGVNKTNQLLTFSKVDTDLVKQYKAEAKFLRAFYHFELVRAYGPVPVVTTILEPTDFSIKRNTLTEVYTQIETDLLEAIPLLPLRSEYPSSMAGRVTKGAAQALLGKVYLYWADLKNDDKALFDKAAEQLKAVITSNQYQLVDDYNKLYEFGAGNTTESVFEIQYSAEVPAGWETPGEFINGNAVVQLCGIRGLCKSHAEYAAGWGFMLPTQGLYDSFLPDDTYRRDAAIIAEDVLVANSCPVNAGDQNQSDYTGYWQKKYANYKAYVAPHGGELIVLKDPNQPVIRLADVFLMYAEALVRGNSTQAEALTYVDKVRERAKGPGDNTGSFKTAATLMSEKSWSALDVIWYERRAELAGEGDRWFDLVRSGRASASLFPDGDLRKANFSETDLYLPIPQNDLNLSNGNLTAYPDPSLFN